MAETFGFYDTEELVDGTYDREYIAQQWADYFKLFIGTGVFASPTNQLKVVAGEGMNIIIKEGWAFIEGRWYHNDADLVIPVQPNTTASTITSGVFIQADSANRVIKAIIATGRTTPDREAPYYELELAQIQLATGTTAITNSMITDTRMDETVCGVVKGLLDGVVSTGDLFAQYNDIFQNWFNSMRNQLSGDAAGNLQVQLDTIRSAVVTNLLNPSLLITQTQTTHGLTITNNGDGTFTLDGTSDSNVGTDGWIGINLTQWGADTEICQGYSHIKLCGCPSGFQGNIKLQIVDTNPENANWYQDNGSGADITLIDNKLTLYVLRIEVKPNVTINNAVFKPMLTPILEATYEDYVEYCGEGKLNSNTLELYKSMKAVNDNLTAENGESFRYSVQNGKPGCIRTLNGVETFFPFNKGAILLGEYSTTTVVNVSELRAESANQFIAVPSGSDSYAAPATSASDVSNYYGMGWINVTGYYVAPSLRLSNGSLTVTPARVGSGGSSNHASAAAAYKNMATKVYFLGDVEAL